MSIKVAINGFGRIGRLVARHLRARDGFDLVAVNDLTSPDMLGYLFAHDSVHGPYKGTVEVDGSDLIIDGDRMQVLAERDPAKLPWKELGVDYVFEATGRFRSRETAAAHLDAGAKRVVITAPGQDVDETFVMGVNNELYDPEKHFVVSNASCTTNCLAPMAKVLDEAVGIKHGWLTTTHAYTLDQSLLDTQHPKDMRRARAAAINIIPSSTGAAMRVPVADGSVCDLIFVTGTLRSRRANSRAPSRLSRSPRAGRVTRSPGPPCTRSSRRSAERRRSRCHTSPRLGRSLERSARSAADPPPSSGSHR